MWPLVKLKEGHYSELTHSRILYISTSNAVRWLHVKGTFYAASQPEFNPQGPHLGRREITLKSCPLSSSQNIHKSKSKHNEYMFLKF